MSGVTIKIRRDTAADWTAVNPVLHEGEIGWEEGTNKIKIGDGVTSWISLGYFTGPVTSVDGRIGAIDLGDRYDPLGAADAAVTNLVNAAPGALDTLRELADAMGDDANFAATMTAALAGKIPLTEKGAASGVAPLDALSRVPEVNVPSYATQASLAATYGSYLNAKSTGAVGDGVANDRAAIQSAIDAATALGIATVFLPAGTYLLGSSLTPKAGVRVLGLDATIKTTFTGPAFYAGPTDCSGFTLDSLTFFGTVNEFPATPKRGRTTSGAGMESAVVIDGSLNPYTPTYAAHKDFLMVNCAVRNCSGLPILIRGVRGVVKVTGNRFENNLDVGFTFNESVIFSNNHIHMSADNGVSLSRGNRETTCTGNTIENCCYNGIWVSGFASDLGATRFAIVGNTIRDVGHNGIDANDAPKYGVIIGNEIDLGYFRGPSDQPTDSNGAGVFVAGSPDNDRANPTAWAEGIIVQGNAIYRAARCGVYLNGVKNSSVIGNQITNAGSEFKADGTTAIGTSDATTNAGILMENSTTSSNVVVALNNVVDARATPFLNWSVVPQSTSAIMNHLNTMVGTRNVYNLLETGPARTWTATHIFSSNMKNSGGGTAGSNAGTGLIPGYDVNGAAGSNRPFRILTASVERWRIGGTGDTESGGNVGTNFQIARYSDAGALIGKMLEMTRDGKIGFNAAAPVAKPAVTGSRGGNAALASLITALANLGLITDSTSA